MRLGVWGVAAAAFVAMLLLDTQAVLQLGWMAALGRLGAWPQRLLLGAAVAAVAGRLVVAGLRRRAARPTRRAAKPAAASGKAARKGPPAPGPKGRRPAAPGVAAASSRAQGRPSRA